MWFRNNALFEKSNPILLCGEESVFVGVWWLFVVWFFFGLGFFELEQN